MSRYDNNEMYTEALNTYAVITKNRMFNNAGKLKVMAFNGLKEQTGLMIMVVWWWVLIRDPL